MKDVWPTTDMTDISWDFPIHRHFDLMQTLLNSMRVVEIHHYRGITFIKRDLISFLHWFNYTCPIYKFKCYTKCYFFKDRGISNTHCPFWNFPWETADVLKKVANGNCVQYHSSNPNPLYIFAPSRVRWDLWISFHLKGKFSSGTEF